MRGQLAPRLQALLPHLNERQRRLLVAAEARGLGHGGIRIVAQAVGVSETTVRKGIAELDTEPLPNGRVRRPGGGRKTVADKNPDLVRRTDSVRRVEDAWIQPLQQACGEGWLAELSMTATCKSRSSRGRIREI